MFQLNCTLETVATPIPGANRNADDPLWGPLSPDQFPVNIEFASSSHLPECRDTLKRLQRKRLRVADTTKIEDKLERKKVKRAARKKAAPKAKRTGPRGENKKKLKKLARGQSKR